VPKNVLVHFANSKGESLGVFEVPVTAGPQQFQELVNGILPEADRDEFNFFHLTKEIKTKLNVFFQQVSYTNFEANLEVTYHPVSNFKVRPVTRASSSMYGHTEAVLSIAFSPDCKGLASGSGDGTLRLWDVFTQTPLKELKADNWVMIVQWAPDAEKLAFAEKNGNITVYYPEKDEQVKLPGHSKWVTSLAWIPQHLSQDCNRLVSASKDCTVRLWNTLNGTCERAFGNHTKCVTKVLWSGRNEIFTGS
jgi:ribosome assembly protein 4